MSQRWSSKAEAGRETLLIEIYFVTVPVIKFVDSPQIPHETLDEVMLVGEWSVYCRIGLHRIEQEVGDRTTF